MPATLFAVPASHPCAAVEVALRLKAVPYRRVDLPPMAHVPVQVVLFGRRTVPAVRFADGERVQGSRPIVRALETRAPAPPLLPADPAARAAVELAEEWGDQVLQPIGRRVVWAALRRAPQAAASYTAGARLPVPPAVALGAMPLVARLEGAMNHATDGNVRADLINLPQHLARIEDWMDAGVLGGAAPNAADLQIGAGLALLATIEDLAPLLDRRAMEIARRWFPGYPGRAPAGTLPGAWITAAAPAAADPPA